MPSQPSDTRAGAPARRPLPSSEPRSWLGDAVRALFVREPRVRRADGKVALAPKQKPDQKPDAQAASPMRAALKALLDAAPESRARLRFLAAVEHGLKHKDPTGLFLFEVEVDRLRAALRQFDALVPATPSEALTALRTRLADAIGSRENKRKRLEAIAPRVNPIDHRIEVAEARASDFARLQEKWKAGSPAS